MPDDIQFDLLTVGGGPAGMMAAITAAQHGASVIVVDKNIQLGKKLMMTGGGRCNLTHSGTPQEMIDHIPYSGKSMYKAFHRFHSAELIAFFEQLGVTLIKDGSGKYFPASQQTKEIQVVLTKALKIYGVSVIRSKVLNIDKTPYYYTVHTADGNVRSTNVLISTGGSTYPGTGSSGDGYKFAGLFGHTVFPVEPGLVPLESPFLSSGELAGISLQRVGLQCFTHTGKLKFSQKGEMLFTHDGVSGPLILDASLYLLEYDFPVELVLTLPKDYATTYPKRFLQFFATTIADQEKARGEISIRFRCSQKKGWDHAMVTLGGVSMQEMNPQTFESRLSPGLFFAGEVLDCHGKTGGYNLQIAFTTGYIVGETVAKRIHPNS